MRPTLRCALRWPPGHLDEVVPYVDPVLGRWRAAARCVRCGRLRGLPVGAGSGSGLPADPILLTLPASLLTGGPRREARALGVPDAAGLAVEVPMPDGRRMLVRRARLAGGRVVHTAAVAGEGDRLAAVSEDLGECLARAGGPAVSARWVDTTVRQLGDELTVA